MSMAAAARHAARIAIVALVAGCDAGGAPAPPPSGASAATVQALDPALREAFRLAVAGEGEAARAAVSHYLDVAGSEALRYQAEFVTGYSYQALKVYTPASEHLQRATELAPDYQAPWHFLGFARYYLGDLDGARAAFERHLQLVPGEGEDWFGLGLVDRDRDRLDEAEHDFLQAIELNTTVLQRDPQGRARAREVSKARARLADVYADRGRWEQARAQLEEAVRLYPLQPDVWHKLHAVRLRLGDADGAAEALRRRDEARAVLEAAAGDGADGSGADPGDDR